MRGGQLHLVQLALNSGSQVRDGKQVKAVAQPYAFLPETQDARATQLLRAGCVLSCSVILLEDGI